MTAHGNPEEIRGLAATITGCRTEAQAALERGLHALDRVDWHDPAQVRYAEQHQDAFRSCLNALAQLDALGPQLQAHAHRLETYLQGG